MLKNIITFDRSLKNEILEILNKTVVDGFVVEKNNISQKVLTSNGEELEAKKFAGMKRGSEIYFKKDLISLIDLADRLE